MREDMLDYARRKGWANLTEMEQFAFQVHQDAVDIVLSHLAPKGPNALALPEIPHMGAD